MANFELFGKRGRSLALFSRSLSVQAPQPENQQQLERGGSIRRSSRFSSSSGLFFKLGKVSSLRHLFESSSSKPSPRGDGDSQNQKEEPPAAAVPSLRAPLIASSTVFNELMGEGRSPVKLPGTEDRIVIFFTSLRGIRRTFEDCYTVRMIFKGFRVCADERDVSMDLAYRKELEGAFAVAAADPGPGSGGGRDHEKTDVVAAAAAAKYNCNNNNNKLPQVFIRGKHVGGAEVIKQLCETGELAQVLEGFPRMPPGFVCNYCGDVRFVPCWNCSGSRKVFNEDEGILKRCFHCNENGLVRCPSCCCC
ncbi:hypothetical protein SAY87_012547 [Trapa incisa]|uniref:Glutaredoxin domain-containing protein n=1 Tax=Trapa incisa TaxID=236973 RepID=A0AAN7GQ51_9MYRT|nr:hypothetical protein SAY87_012547 [Trapa incisa]